MIINGFELQVDLYDADFAEHYEKALELIRKPSLDKDAKLSDCIRHECQKVCDFFDELFGAGTANTIFKGKVNLNTALDYADLVIDEIISQRQAMEARTAKYKSIDCR